MRSEKYTLYYNFFIKIFLAFESFCLLTLFATLLCEKISNRAYFDSYLLKFFIYLKYIVLYT